MRRSKEIGLQVIAQATAMAKALKEPTKRLRCAILQSALISQEAIRIPKQARKVALCKSERSLAVSSTITAGHLYNVPYISIGTFQELSTYTSRDYPWGNFYAYFGVAFLKTTGHRLLIDLMIHSFFHWVGTIRINRLKQPISVEFLYTTG